MVGRDVGGCIDSGCVPDFLYDEDEDDEAKSTLSDDDDNLLLFGLSVVCIGCAGSDFLVSLVSAVLGLGKAGMFSSLLSEDDASITSTNEDDDSASFFSDLFDLAELDEPTSKTSVEEEDEDEEDFFDDVCSVLVGSEFNFGSSV